MTACLGDLNGDCYVQGFDLALLLGQWGPCASHCCDADLNDDGVVDGFDLADLLGNWDSSSPCDSACKAVAPPPPPPGGGEGAAAPASATVLDGGGAPSAEELIQGLIDHGYPELAALLSQILGIPSE